MHTLLYIFMWLMISLATAYFANQRGRDPIAWMMIGMLLGFIGLCLVLILPAITEEEKPSEAEYELLEPRGDIIQPALTQDYRVKEWYYYDKLRQRHGPISFEHIKQLWKENEVNEETFIWSDGMDAWKRIDEVPSLHTYLQLS